MSWRVAHSLEKLRSQVNERWPTRSKENDGTIGDAGHSARESDHNPDRDGVVCAMDITHDPKSGCDSYALAEVFRASRDPRIKYIISNRKICSSQVDPWQWRPYHGPNPHDHHVHVSVIDERKLYDDVATWNLDAKPMPAPVPIVVATPPTLRKGANGSAVEDLQRALNARSIIGDIDGKFGTATYLSVKRFQQSRGLVADGVVGPQTWNALKQSTTGA